MRMLSLFSGIGGIDLAAQWAGIETVAFCEIEPFCQKVLQKHWPDVLIFDDVKKLNKQLLTDTGVMSDEQPIDIICGGYPCQPFSVAGERKGENDDRHLWPEVSRLLQEIKPTWFLGENVAGHVTLGLDDVLSDLERIGYSAEPFIIPACAVGAVHRRDRVFILAYTDSDRRMEQTGQPQKVQQSGIEELQPKESRESNVPESIYSSEISNGTYPNGKHMERCIEQEIQGQSSLQGVIHPGSIEEWARRSTLYQPKLCGTYNGVPNGVDRVKSLGNAVVPQQVYPIFLAMRQAVEHAI